MVNARACHALVFFLLLALTGCNESSNRDNANSHDAGKAADFIYLADPTIFIHDSLYYLSGTNGDTEYSSQEGFLVYTSPDLKSWGGPTGATNGFALMKGDAYGDKGFWAPQVFEYKNKFHIAYTANEHIAMAEADSPFGPFTSTSKKELEAPVRQIDPFVLFDEDGKKYLYHVRLTEGNRIFVAELNEDLLSIKPETLTECISVDQPWENTHNADWPVAEGPTVLKHNGLYYLIYSANDFRNPDYAVGFATSESPLGPWTKSDSNPIIHKSMIGINGTGHGDVFMDKDGDMQYVFHTHFSDSIVHPRKTAVIKIQFVKQENGADLLEVDQSTFKFLEQN